MLVLPLGTHAATKKERKKKPVRKGTEVQPGPDSDSRTCSWAHTMPRKMQKARRDLNCGSIGPQ